MNYLLFFVLAASVALAACGGKAKKGSGKKRQVSLVHNRKLMDYLLENSQDVRDTILEGGPGSTELLSQVSGAALGSLTQSWFRCSRKFNVPREVLADNFGQYVAFRDGAQSCAVSCYLEESRMVSNGKLDPAMFSIVTLMAYGDDKDVHRYSEDLVNQCNKQVPSTPAQSCKSAAHMDCFMAGWRRGNVYVPQQILQPFTSPWIMELQS